MGDNAATLAESTWASLASSMSALKLDENLRWAAPLDIKKSLESAFTTAFGTKEDYNKAQKAQPKSAKAAPAKANGKEPQASTSAGSASSTSMFQEGFLAALHPVGGNPQIHSHLKDEHMKATGGLVHTRFPPEPNGKHPHSPRTMCDNLTIMLSHRLPAHRTLESHRRKFRICSVPQGTLLPPLR
jgi:glutaminyl-tRNA synthetase